MAHEAKHPVETSRKSFRLLEAIKERDGARVTELATALDMGKSTVHNQIGRAHV